MATFSTRIATSLSRQSVALAVLVLLGGCGGGGSSDGPDTSAGAQFSVDLAEIRVVRLDNDVPVIIEGSANNGSVITLGD
ncbi:hypothetical protein [Marinobacter halotolerans]|uniref:hypothetical protein n=1 Tax=Marinobacter halotolerans TaxID=1569211 RepID=UPI00124644CE|nr:hypothetical protein [Marinobacter halotolerans]